MSANMSVLCRMFLILPHESLSVSSLSIFQFLQGTDVTGML